MHSVCSSDFTLISLESRRYISDGPVYGVSDSHEIRQVSNHGVLGFGVRGRVMLATSYIYACSKRCVSVSGNKVPRMSNESVSRNGRTDIRFSELKIVKVSI